MLSKRVALSAALCAFASNSASATAGSEAFDDRRLSSLDRRDPPGLLLELRSLEMLLPFLLIVRAFSLVPRSFYAASISSPPHPHFFFSLLSRSFVDLSFFDEPLSSYRPLLCPFSPPISSVPRECSTATRGSLFPRANRSAVGAS